MPKAKDDKLLSEEAIQERLDEMRSREAPHLAKESGPEIHTDIPSTATRREPERAPSEMPSTARRAPEPDIMQTRAATARDDGGIPTRGVQDAPVTGETPPSQGDALGEAIRQAYKEDYEKATQSPEFTAKKEEVLKNIREQIAGTMTLVGDSGKAPDFETIVQKNGGNRSAATEAYGKAAEAVRPTQTMTKEFTVKEFSGIALAKAGEITSVQQLGEVAKAAESQSIGKPVVVTGRSQDGSIMLVVKGGNDKIDKLLPEDRELSSFDAEHKVLKFKSVAEAQKTVNAIEREAIMELAIPKANNTVLVQASGAHVNSTVADGIIADFAKQGKQAIVVTKEDSLLGPEYRMYAVPNMITSKRPDAVQYNSECFSVGSKEEVADMCNEAIGNAGHNFEIGDGGPDIRVPSLE